MVTGSWCRSLIVSTGSQRFGMEDLIVGGLLAEMPRLVKVDYVSNHPPQKLTPEFRRAESASRGTTTNFCLGWPHKRSRRVPRQLAV
jgi:hypothetical protein